MESNMRPFSVFLVEDDEIDILNIERSFKANNITNALFKAQNGEDALRMLRSGKIPRPLIILLDLSMPKMGGHDFLAELREDPVWKDVPVIIMTVSTEESDKSLAYKRNVQGYIVKPMKFDDFVQAIARINAYWTMCELPNE
jgi:CheY-like chemotaxis protein